MLRVTPVLAQLDDTNLWPIVAGVLVAVLVLLVLVKALWRKPKPVQIASPNLAIDVQALSRGGPPATGPRLLCYHVPMRLAAIVLAPTGRVSELPPPEQLSQVIDH